MKNLKIMILCFLYFYGGYFYSHVFEHPKYIGGILRDDGWLIIKISPRIPIPGFNFYKTIRIDDYSIDRAYDNYLYSRCVEIMKQ